jgi:preprotein translocase subunit SecE
MTNSVKTAEIKTSSSRDVILWVLVGVLIAAGIVAYYYFQDIAWALRVAGGLVLICIVIALAYQTHQGKQVWSFAKAARMELRKVVWPTRQETVQMTLLVVAMVVVMALILWGIDTFLLWLVSFFTGQRG